MRERAGMCEKNTINHVPLQPHPWLLLNPLYTWNPPRPTLLTFGWIAELTSVFLGKILFIQSLSNVWEQWVCLFIYLVLKMYLLIYLYWYWRKKLCEAVGCRQRCQGAVWGCGTLLRGTSVEPLAVLGYKPMSWLQKATNCHESLIKVVVFFSFSNNISKLIKNLYLRLCWWFLQGNCGILIRIFFLF